MPAAAPHWPGPLRPATAADLPALAALYAGAAQALGPQVYTPAQVAAWAAFGADTPAFRDYVLAAETWVAVDADGSALGFCGVAALAAPCDEGLDAEVKSLYVRADAGRRGIASSLLARVLDRSAAQGWRRLGAWVTPFSQPLFTRAGFAEVQRLQTTWQGVAFERCRMHRLPR